MRRSLRLALYAVVVAALTTSAACGHQAAPQRHLAAVAITVVHPSTIPAPAVEGASHRSPPRASRSRPLHLPAAVGTGTACGGDLPPCWVMMRESGGDPTIWNGRCHMPVGSTGRCGASDASGKWQILRSTWGAHRDRTGVWHPGYGGYMNAADAPVGVQDDKARLLWANGRGCRHWAACG